ncbi:Fanconi anemia group I protein [Fasciola gigantica]|uniref:Fanconi anemia group I protein n=1 Tax=Fasciola gigantica TaxID=46835 RepID=A0A504YDM0_FASGI|nr:Fanconi anemia group I protein [Fasciola gigantica]
MEVACRASRFDPILDSIGLLPQELAIGLVHAVLPLIRAGNQIDRQYAPTVFNTHPEGPTLVEDHPINRVRNRLFTALRKAASSPRVLSRRNAVACFLLLLKHLKVSVTAFRSASQNSSGSLSQFSLMSQTQATQNNPGLLYTQLQSTQGLCEVVTRNRGLVEPVVTLYVRLLVGCLSPGFLRHLKQTHGLASLTVPAVLEPGNSQTSPAMNAVLPLSLEHVIQLNAETNEIRRTEHPTAEMDLGSNTTGKVNRERANVLLGLYDACLEFELKAPLDSMRKGGITDQQTPTMTHLIRYYDHKLSSLVAPSCPETPISNVTQPAGASGANNPEIEAKARITASVSAAALSVLDTAFTLILDQLGTERLHHLIVLLYPVVCQPQYRDPVPDPDSGDAGDELIDSAVVTEDSDSGSCPIPEISPAQALSALIKLIKINLMNNVKLAVSRDFRINQAAVQAQLERSVTLSLSSDSEAAEEILETNSNHEELREEAYSPRAPHSPNVETDAEGTTTNHSHLVMTSELDEPVIGDKGDVENRQPANSKMSHTPAWGRALQPDATRRSLLNRPARSASHTVTINKSKRLGPRN